MESLSDISTGPDLDFFSTNEEATPSIPLSVKRILVPTDFSEGSAKVLNYARSMAEAFQATIILLHVVEPASRAQAMHPEALEQSRSRLASACNSRNHNVSFEPLVRVGRPHSEIADTAKALACDMIIMGTRGRTHSATLGSTAQWVVHHASCPVLTMRP